MHTSAYTLGFFLAFLVLVILKLFGVINLAWPWLLLSWTGAIFLLGLLVGFVFWLREPLIEREGAVTPRREK